MLFISNAIPRQIRASVMCNKIKLLGTIDGTDDTLGPETLRFGRDYKHKPPPSLNMAGISAMMQQMFQGMGMDLPPF
jgi:hypothetical protein